MLHITLCFPILWSTFISSTILCVLLIPLWHFLLYLIWIFLAWEELMIVVCITHHSHSHSLSNFFLLLILIYHPSIILHLHPSSPRPFVFSRRYSHISFSFFHPHSSPSTIFIFFTTPSLFIFIPHLSLIAVASSFRSSRLLLPRFFLTYNKYSNDQNRKYMPKCYFIKSHWLT